MDLNKKSTVLITCSRGLVPYLEQEVKQLGFTPVSSHSTGLEIQATLADTMRLNLCLRTAFNILYLLKNFNCTAPEQLYKAVACLC